MKRLFVDIETSPNLVFSWRTGYKIFIDYQNIVRERAIICICYKWEHEKDVKYFKWDKNQSDKNMVQGIVNVMNEADEIVGQNLDRFDIPWIKTRAVIYGITTNPHWKTIDTLTFSKKRLYFNSNKLDYMGEVLGLGGKIKTDFSLWKEIVLNKNSKSLNKMIEYCKRDVILLEKVYHRLATHMAVQTHAGVLDESEKWTCGRCGSANVKIALTRVSAQGVIRKQMVCNKCGGFYTISNLACKRYVDVKAKEKQAQIKHEKKMKLLNKMHKKKS
jgi:ribosomal protein S27AE